MKKIKIYHSSGWGTDFEKISSGVKYDKNLVNAFPHFCYVTNGEGRHFAGLIAGGIHKMSVYGYPSFALTLDYNSDGKVLWLSDSAVRLLSILEDNYEFEDVDYRAMYQEPTHLVLKEQ